MQTNVLRGLLKCPHCTVLNLFYLCFRKREVTLYKIKEHLYEVKCTYRGPHFCPKLECEGGNESQGKYTCQSEPQQVFLNFINRQNLSRSSIKAPYQEALKRT